MSKHRHHDHSGTHHVDFDTKEMAEFAEVEGEVLIGLVTRAIEVVAQRCSTGGVDVRRVLDLGCGPGVGSCSLAQRFGSALVVAVDGSPMMLERASARAERLGLADRVETRLVEFPAGLDSLGSADVAWASMALHHVGDEADALRRIEGLLEPGGLIALVERADPMRVLHDTVDLGRPGIWDRLDAAWEAWFADMRADLPGATTSDDYPAMLDATGFEVVADEVLGLVVDQLDDRARRYAHGRLNRTREHFGSHADPADLDALDALLDEHADDGIMRRPDAQIRASRHLFVGRVRR